MLVRIFKIFVDIIGLLTSSIFNYRENIIEQSCESNFDPVSHLNIEPLFAKKLNDIYRKKANKIKRLQNIPIHVQKKLESFLKSRLFTLNMRLHHYKYELTIPNKIDDPYIYIINDSLSHKECDRIITLFENECCIKHFGVVGSGYRPETKRTIEYNISTSSNNEFIFWNKICFERLNAALHKYTKHCYEKNNNHELIKILEGSRTGYYNINDTGYQIQKYFKNTDFYEWHHDSHMKQYEREQRIITFIWYLNNVEEGGETLFYNGKVHPKKGSLLLFPATWTYNHKGNIPISNDKYIITGWIYCNI